LHVGRILRAVAPARAPGRFSALAGLALVAGCATRGGDIPYEPAGFGAPDALTRNALPQDLPLGPLDQIKVTVFRVPDLSGDYTVGGDGTLAMPLIGKIDARDKTPDQLAGDLRAAYATRYLNDPQITVRVIQSNQRNVVVEGGVRSAGIFPLAGKTTLVGAVALASGIDNDNGNPRRVAIFRRIGGKTI
jgi:polysaccharide biosynthesis/export protein